MEQGRHRCRPRHGPTWRADPRPWHAQGRGRVPTRRMRGPSWDTCTRRQGRATGAGTAMGPASRCACSAHISRAALPPGQRDRAALLRGGRGAGQPARHERHGRHVPARLRTRYEAHARDAGVCCTVPAWTTLAGAQERGSAALLHPRGRAGTSAAQTLASAGCGASPCRRPSRSTRRIRRCAAQPRGHVL